MKKETREKKKSGTQKGRFKDARKREYGTERSARRGNECFTLVGTRWRGETSKRGDKQERNRRLSDAGQKESYGKRTDNGGKRHSEK